MLEFFFSSKEGTKEQDWDIVPQSWLVEEHGATRCYWPSKNTEHLARTEQPVDLIKWGSWPVAEIAVRSSKSDCPVCFTVGMIRLNLIGLVCFKGV